MSQQFTKLPDRSLRAGHVQTRCMNGAVVELYFDSYSRLYVVSTFGTTARAYREAGTVEEAQREFDRQVEGCK